jgi:segregation and condensation protein B
MSDDRERNPARPAAEQVAAPNAEQTASVVDETNPPAEREPEEHELEKHGPEEHGPVPPAGGTAAPSVAGDPTLPDADDAAPLTDEDATPPLAPAVAEDATPALAQVPAAAEDAGPESAQDAAASPGQDPASVGTAALPAAEGVTATQGLADKLPVTRREPDEDSLRLAEALVFASAEPVSLRALARLLPDDIDADAVLAQLRKRYAGRGVELVDIGNGVMFRTALDLAPRLRKVIEVPRRLPRVALETLAIIAYHQPMTRPEIEHIRGTALSQQTLDSLLELNLIAPKGRRETPGRPTLWGTTPEFLAHFGLKDLRELPRREDLLLEAGPPRITPEVLPADLQPPPVAEPGKTAK